MRKTWLYAVSALLFFSCTSNNKTTFRTDFFEVKINPEGYLVEFSDPSRHNFSPKEKPSPLMTLYDDQTGQYYYPQRADYNAEQQVIQLEYPNGAIASVKVEEKGQYLKLTLESLENRDGIDAIAWGPFATNISQHIGETVGVVRDSLYAIGVQALNLYTTEGQPHLGDDAGGGFYVDPLPGQEVPDEYKDKIGQKIDPINVNETGDMPDFVRQWRGSAAAKTPYGSDIQFFARDWRTGRTVDLYGRRQQIAPLEQDFVGSSIALFGVPTAQVLDVIETIELNEGLPHPEINGVWIKRLPLNKAYMLYEGGSLDNALNYADSCAFDLIHIGDVFKSWGHFDLHTSRFPDGAPQIKAFTDQARQRGKEIGVHTLTMFTSQHDPYVSPVPSDSLCIAGSSQLTRDISATDTEIEIESPEFFRNPDLTHTVKIGKELIQYREVSAEAPYKLMNCTRGQFGTRPAAHAADAQVDKLVNNSYSGFFPDYRLKDRYADRLSTVCDETGIGLMDFDGYYGGSPDGHGVYGAARFIDRWYRGLDRYVLTCGSQTFHYFWHIYSFMNWGEPWYDNLRQSQVNYRTDNQRYFERNLMPGMLGWFKLEPTYRPEDIEWIQARSAAFNAGYLLRVDEGIEQNGFKSTLFSAIREWQQLRKLGLFTPEQREQMKDPNHEYHLEKNGDNSWQLYDVTLDGNHVHKFRSVQTGEPLLSKFTFQNPYETQAVQFYATILPGEKGTGEIRNLRIDVAGAASIEIPTTLKAGDKIYSDGRAVYVCDGCWKPRAQYPLPATSLWSKGDNAVTVQCDFSSATAPVIELEFKALGNPQTITAQK